MVQFGVKIQLGTTHSDSITISVQSPNNSNQATLSASATRKSELPFTLQDIKAAIPAHCFEPSVGKSLSYFFIDISIIAGLYFIAYKLDSWLFFPIFWVMQGTMFWALFVVGHDCGHGSFSKIKWLNNLIGHLSHIPILVPYHGWRISHRKPITPIPEILIPMKVGIR